MTLICIPVMCPWFIGRTCYKVGKMAAYTIVTNIASKYLWRSLCLQFVTNMHVYRKKCTELLRLLWHKKFSIIVFRYQRKLICYLNRTTCKYFKCSRKKWKETKFSIFVKHIYQLAMGRPNFSVSSRISSSDIEDCLSKLKNRFSCVTMYKAAMNK